MVTSVVPSDSATTSASWGPRAVSSRAPPPVSAKARSASAATPYSRNAPVSATPPADTTATGRPVPSSMSTAAAAARSSVNERPCSSSLTKSTPPSALRTAKPTRRERKS